MSKFTDFYAKAATDENAKTKLSGILGGKAINEADDEQLKKISILAKELGFEITVDEAKNYLNNDNAELDDDDLEAVAGGTNKINDCIYGGHSFLGPAYEIYSGRETTSAVDLKNTVSK